MYRDDYERAGYVVLPGGRGRVPFVKWLTVGPLLALVVVSLLPVVLGQAGPVHSVGALSLDAAFVYRGVQFASQRSNSSARRLLLASIIYLPLLLLLLTLS
jgi:protoheme IX farnesyltransferase